MSHTHAHCDTQYELETQHTHTRARLRRYVRTDTTHYERPRNNNETVPLGSRGTTKYGRSATKRARGVFSRSCVLAETHTNKPTCAPHWLATNGDFAMHGARPTPNLFYVLYCCCWFGRVWCHFAFHAFPVLIFQSVVHRACCTKGKGDTEQQLTMLTYRKITKHTLNGGQNVSSTRAVENDDRYPLHTEQQQHTRARPARK